MNNVNRVRPRLTDTRPGEHSGVATLCASIAVVFSVFAWGLFLSGMSSELSGVTAHSHRGSYVAAGALGLAGIVATTIAGVLGRGATRTTAAAAFWLLIGPALYGGLMFVALIAG